MTPLETVLAALTAAGCEPRQTSRGWHARCPGHGDTNPSLAIETGDDGRVLLRCFAGCKPPAILDALKLTWQHLFPDGTPYRQAGARAPRRRSSVTRPAPRPIPEPVPPVPDRDKLIRVLEHGLEAIQTPAAAPWLKKRGVTLETCLTYGVGFMPWLRLLPWKGPIPRVWVIPVSGPDGRPLALKLHRENPPPGRSKGLWAPLGTMPPDKPRHGWPTLWPAPESFPPREILYLLPGELKALAVLGAGRAACSPTAGEGFHWTPGLLARLAGRRVVLVYDDDPAGQHFRDVTSAALHGVAGSFRAITFGRQAPALPAAAPRALAQGTALK